VEFNPAQNQKYVRGFNPGTEHDTRKQKSRDKMITFKQFTQWQGQYCCVKTGNLEIITTDKHLGVLCQCKACFSAEFYDPRILEEYAGNKNGAGVVGGKRDDRVVEKI